MKYDERVFLFSALKVCSCPQIHLISWAKCDSLTKRDNNVSFCTKERERIPMDQCKKVSTDTKILLSFLQINL